MELIQARLDVKNKSRSNIFNWRGQFTPEFVDYILDSFSSPGDLVVDPFSGSGTVLLESARKGLSSFGFEVNPAAYAMSKFFSFCNMPREDRQSIAYSFQKKVNSLLADYDALPLFTPSPSYRTSYTNLLKFLKELISHTTNPYERLLTINSFFIAEDYKNGSIGSTISRAIDYLLKCLLYLPYTSNPIQAALGDGRSFHENLPRKANLVFTSPPYINVFNYHQNHRAIIEALGCNVLDIAPSEIGSNRKNRGNRFKTVVQYCLDMELSLNSIWHSMCPNGLLVIVVGRESNVRKIPFFNGQMVNDIAVDLNCFSDIQKFNRSFINKFGKDINEDIIVMQKNSTSPSASVASRIAQSHLGKAIDSAPESIKEEIHDAIQSINSINPSPYLLLRRNCIDEDPT